MTMVNVGDYSFKPLTEAYVDPLEIVAIGLKLGQKKMDNCIAAAKARGLREYAIIGDCSVRVALHPPKDLRPPDGWSAEFIKAKYLARAKAIVQEAFPQFMASQRVEHVDIH